jgi:anti-sigma regulatory factor (Ser/Thr protein kinase)
MGQFDRSSSTGKLPLREGGDVVRCRQEVKRLSDLLSYSEVGRTMLMTAASELARNALVHGRGGERHASVSHSLANCPSSVVTRPAFMSL